MEIYRNLGGDSNVARYEIGPGSITVQFKSGAQRNYLYDDQRPGAGHVVRLQELAVAGRGLNSYIGRNLRTPMSYSRKW